MKQMMRGLKKILTLIGKRIILLYYHHVSIFTFFFLGILSSICFFSVRNEAKDRDNSPWKWESVWSIFMTEYINGIKKKIRR